MHFGHKTKKRGLTPFSFDVQAYTLETPTAHHSHISLPPAYLTGGRPTIIRWSGGNVPRLGTHPYTSANQALKTAQRHRQHLAVLESSGIYIPRHSMFVGDDPNHGGSPAIYAAVEHIDTQRPLNLETTPRAYKTLGRALMRYANWLSNTNQDQMLCDIATSAQYVCDAEQQPILLDIEPVYLTTHGHYGKMLMGLLRDNAQAFIEAAHSE